MSTHTRGLFVTFEGIDGSGKSTQIARCAAALQAQGYDVVLTRNPGGTAFGEQLRQILLHSTQTVYPMSELLLFIADRAQHMDEVVFPALKRGAIVLCDRHLDSTVAYQGYGRSLSLQTIQDLNQIAIQGQKPDLTILLDGEPALLAQRVASRGKVDRLEGEPLAFRSRVREGYQALARQEPNRIHTLNALDDMDSLQAQILSLITAKLAEPVVL